VYANVFKHFGNATAVDNFSLTVNKRELLTLLGPSGCGKTTTLRMTAGLETVDSGSILINGKDVTTVPIYRRNLGMVFQNYALFPHMTVFDNLAFGLKFRKKTKNETTKLVDEALRLVALPGFGDRYPRQLSGGQQQRIALARALVIEPEVLLLDEPLSNLDMKLRRKMRLEIRRIQREVGITTIYVTHDQEEALTMSDRVAIMNAGRIMQVGRPREIYQCPNSQFVANFIGEPNLLHGRILSANREFVISIDSQRKVIAMLQNASSEKPASVGDSVSLCLRPERVELNEKSIHKNSFAGEIGIIEYLGSFVRYYVDLGRGLTLACTRQMGLGEPVRSLGEKVYIGWEPEDCLVLPEERTGEF
jgi:spermidine/putrescine transport system ATP-binding protein